MQLPVSIDMHDIDNLHFNRIQLGWIVVKEVLGSLAVSFRILTAY